MTDNNIVGKFTRIPNEILDNVNLSPHAKFIMAYILRLDKKTWDFSLTGLSKITGMSLRAVSKAFDELIAERYCYKKWLSGGRGKCGWFYLFSTTHFSKLQNSKLENSSVENSKVELSKLDVFYFRKNASNIILYNIEDYNNPILKEIKDYILSSQSAQKGQKKSKKKKPEEYSLGYRCRKNFEEYFKEQYETDYYWEAKDGAATKRLLAKLKKNREDRKKPTNDDDMVKAFDGFIRSISDKWVREHFNMTIIDSKFNDIVAAAFKKSNEKQAPDGLKYDHGYLMAQDEWIVELPKGELRRTYGTGKPNIPLDAPPKPGQGYSYDRETNTWIY